MSTYQTQDRSAVALFRMAAIVRAADGRVRAAVNEFLAWLEKRRVAATAFHDFETMSERELRDIGLNRADVNRVAWGASDRQRDPG